MEKEIDTVVVNLGHNTTPIDSPMKIPMRNKGKDIIDEVIDLNNQFGKKKSPRN